jgi:DNA-binding MarR family transcriptional regulator
MNQPRPRPADFDNSVLLSVYRQGLAIRLSLHIQISEEAEPDLMHNDNHNHAIDIIARNCIAVRIRLLNRVVTNLYDNALRRIGLRVSQLNILVVTAKLGLATPGKVCSILQLDASTLSRNVDRMRLKSWLEVVPGKDARAQPFRLTHQGRKLLDRAVPAWKKAQRQATNLLGDRGIRLITAAAGKLGLPC